MDSAESGGDPADTAYHGGDFVAEVIRSGFTESFHRGSVAVAGPDGRLLAAVGDVAGPVFVRSSGKPLQALAMLRAGWRPESDADLAIASASHQGEPMHVTQVDSVLTHAGLGEDQLQCPPDLPGDPAARRAVIAVGGGARRVYMNCSGKHAGMLAACAAKGWDTDDYLDPEHPFQQLVREAIEDMCGEQVAHTAVDGCGAPQLAVTLVGLARGVQSMRLSPEGTPERSVLEAMSTHPEYVSGTDRIDTELMRRVPGLVSKVGADGVLVLSAPTGETVAVKISDGDAELRARTLVGVTALRALGVDVEPIADHLTTDVHGGGGVVGHVGAL